MERAESATAPYIGLAKTALNAHFIKLVNNYNRVEKEANSSISNTQRYIETLNQLIYSLNDLILLDSNGIYKGIQTLLCKIQTNMEEKLCISQKILEEKSQSNRAEIILTQDENSNVTDILKKKKEKINLQSLIKMLMN